jgi:hypothetical protein
MKANERPRSPGDHRRLTVIRKFPSRAAQQQEADNLSTEIRATTMLRKITAQLPKSSRRHSLSVPSDLIACHFALRGGTYRLLPASSIQPWRIAD